MITITARADCRYCHGSGTVSDSVPYGMGNVSMDSDCEDCITAGWPEGVDPDAEYEIITAWAAQSELWARNDEAQDWITATAAEVITDAERREQELYDEMRQAAIESTLQDCRRILHDYGTDDEEGGYEPPTLGNQVI